MKSSNTNKCKYILIALLIFLISYIIIFFLNKKENFYNINDKVPFNIFYINLKERDNRKQLLENEFLKLNESKNYNFIDKRIDAIKDSEGAIGCGKSHIKSLKNAKKNNLDYVIIMEDDIEIKKNKIEKYFNIIQNMKKWDVIILSGHGEKTPYNNYLSKATGVQTTGMYIIKKHYYDSLIDNFNESVDNMVNLKNKNKDIRRSKWAIDMNWKKLQKKDNWYIFNENLGVQRPGYSDIEKTNVNYDMIV
jgi:glycosyl transferase family 25